MSGVASKGTVLLRGAVNVGSVVSIGGPNVSATVIDMSSLADLTRVKAAGIIDNGEVTVEINFVDDAGQEAVRGDIGAAATAYSVDWSNLYTADFNAFVSGWQPNTGTVDDKLTVSVTLTITGAVTWTNPA